MKKALLDFSWDQIAGLRITYSFIAVLPLAFWYARRFSSKTIVALLVVGLAGSGIPSFLFPYAQTVLDSGLTGILNALTPLFTLLLGVWFFKTKSSVLKIVGVVVGMGGAVMLMVFQPDGTIGFKNYEYGFFVLLATFCYALSTNVIKSALQNIHPVTIAVMSFLMIGPFGATYLFSTDFTSVVKAHPDVVPVSYTHLRAHETP